MNANRFVDFIANILAKAMINLLGLDGFMIKVMNIQPGDYVIVKSAREISEQGWDRLKTSLQVVFPNNKVIALEDSLDLFLMRGINKAKGE